jgi:CO dehydrogenase/acetyl-CoA synthase beta subunit
MTKTKVIKKIKKQKKRISISPGQKKRIERLRKNIAKATRGDKIAAREVAISVRSFREFYDQRAKPIISNLNKKKEKGEYNADLGLLAWSNAVPTALKMYMKEYAKFPVNPPLKARLALELKDEYQDMLIK